MAKKTVIEGSDNVKASQLKEFFRQVDERIITGSVLQNLLENKNHFGLEIPRIGGRDVKRLVELITGGEKKLLTEQQFVVWRELIMFSINSMRNIYERRDPSDSSRKYYEPCWKKIDDAKDDEELIKAIDWLVDSITWY